MSKAEFDKFVKRQRSEEPEIEGFDPEKQLGEWINYIDDLYKQINDFMAAYLESSDATIEYRDVSLHEDFIGPYIAKQMLLKIGHSVITLTPIGTMLIGSKGRIDVKGPKGQARLGLVSKRMTSARQLIKITVSEPGENVPKPITNPEEIEWAWKIITPAPEMRFIDLTQEEFFDMILSVADA